MDAVDLAQYAVRGTEADWDAATKQSKISKGGGGTVSIKSKVCIHFSRPRAPQLPVVCGELCAGVFTLLFLFFVFIC